MARMLGRYETRGCCPGTRQGWRRTRSTMQRAIQRGASPDCSGAATDTRGRKRAEQRAFARDADGLLSKDPLPPGDPAWLSDDSDCQHGCNGDCYEAGSLLCNFTCHEGPATRSAG